MSAIIQSNDEHIEYFWEVCSNYNAIWKHVILLMLLSQELLMLRGGWWLITEDVKLQLKVSGNKGEFFSPSKFRDPHSQLPSSDSRLRILGLKEAGVLGGRCSGGTSYNNSNIRSIKLRGIMSADNCFKYEGFRAGSQVSALSVPRHGDYSWPLRISAFPPEVTRSLNRAFWPCPTLGKRV